LPKRKKGIKKLLKKEKEKTNNDPQKSAQKS
jgi:hypothetical protein